MVKYLVEQEYANVSASEDLEGSPLAYAAMALNDSMEIASYLLRPGAKADRYSILNAVKTNNLEIVKLLIENGADVNSQTRIQTTPLLREIWKWSSS